MKFRLIETYLFEYNQKQIDDFKTKYGDDSWNDFERYQANFKKLKDAEGKLITPDLNYHLKNTSLNDMKQLLSRAKNREFDYGSTVNLDIEGKPIPEPTHTAELIFNQGDEKIYLVHDYEDMIALSAGTGAGDIGGRKTGWCIGGRFNIPFGQVKVSQAKQYFTNYQRTQGDFLVIITPKTKFCLIVKKASEGRIALNLTDNDDNDSQDYDLLKEQAPKAYDFLSTEYEVNFNNTIDFYEVAMQLFEAHSNISEKIDWTFLVENFDQDYQSWGFMAMVDDIVHVPDYTDEEDLFDRFIDPYLDSIENIAVEALLRQYGATTQSIKDFIALINSMEDNLGEYDNYLNYSSGAKPVDKILAAVFAKMLYDQSWLLLKETEEAFENTITSRYKWGFSEVSINYTFEEFSDLIAQVFDDPGYLQELEIHTNDDLAQYIYNYYVDERLSNYTYTDELSDEVKILLALLYDINANNDLYFELDLEDIIEATMRDILIDSQPVPWFEFVDKYLIPVLEDIGISEEQVNEFLPERNALR